MNLVASRPSIRLRTELRKHRWVHRPIVWTIEHVRRSSWAEERAYVDALTRAVRPGDCVWDVGANIGYFTRQFLSLVGSEGRVIAFEPAGACRQPLAQLPGQERLTILQLALSDYDGEAPFSLDRGETGRGNHLGEGNHATETVRVARADTLVSGGLPAPDAVKIDVEGYEGEVIGGLGSLLSSVRTIFMEVHFSILNERGKPEEPTWIVRTLESGGFHIRWADRSHFVADRN